MPNKPFKYYTPYLGHVKEKLHWWVVIKTKPRHIIDNNHQLEVTYEHDEMCRANEIVDNDQIDTLCDYVKGFEETELYFDLIG